MITAPDYIQFYPTLRCNQSCDFCFNGTLPKVPDMGYAEFRHMVTALKGQGVRTLDILGGEPTLHPDLLRFLKYGLQEGMTMNVSSNGIDIVQLSNIMERYPEISVGVSVNDASTAARLGKFIQKYHPIVKSVYNRDLDRELLAALLSMHPKKLYLLYRDALDPARVQETLPFDEYYRTVRREFAPSIVGMVYCSGFLPDIEHYPSLRSARCPAGTTKLGIMPDGGVYPCNLFFGKSEFRLGNILTDPFEAIWRHSSLSFFRTMAHNTCERTTCTLFSSCHGGCPAHSYAFTGTRTSSDPRCFR